MSSHKGHLYATTLDHARRQSLFTVSHPADSHGKLIPVNSLTAQHGPQQGMDWPELVRKFAKHNPTRQGEPRLQLPVAPVRAHCAHAQTIHSVREHS